jgi:hypothetical protein
LPRQLESTMLLRVDEQAFVRIEPLDDGCETQKLLKCPQCHRITDWLIAATDGQVEFTCRCGHIWSASTPLTDVVALAERQPISPQWQSLDDARRALGFGGRTWGFGLSKWHSLRHRGAPVTATSL